MKVVKRDGTRVPFDRSKIRAGLEKACWKRPISSKQLEKLVNQVETHVEGKFDSEVDSRYLGEIVMEYLKDLDQIAYIRYASVYRQFRDAQEFVDELGHILKKD